MNKYIKIIFTSLMMMSTCGLIFAQTDEQSDSADSDDDQIILPEVTTTVSGDSITAGKDAVSDFNSIINVNDETVVLPVLPGVEIEEIPEEPVADLSDENEKRIYAEGLVGAGYPGSFTGDFSVYKSSGADPFLIQFAHDETNGYGLHTASQGFFDKQTNLYGEKKVTLNNLEFNFAGTYDTTSYGLQNRSSDFFDMTYQTLNTSDSFVWNIPYGFYLRVDADGEWFSRYAGIVSDAESYESYKALENSFDLSPKLSFGWKNAVLSFNLYGDYQFDYWSTDLSQMEGQIVNRGEFVFDGYWNNSFIKAGGSAGLVVGSNIGSVMSVIPLFTVVFEGNWNVGSNGRKITLDMKGGLDSVQKLSSEYETKYLYSALSSITSEVTDWYFTLDTDIPISSLFAFDLNGEFRKTAFDNGDYVASYSTSSDIYTFERIDRTLVDTDAQLSFAWNIITLSLDWKSHWIYIPCDDEQFTLGMTFDIQSKESLWGFNIGVREGLGSDVEDYVPFIDCAAYYRISQSVKISAEINDAVKLFTAADRTYSTSGYVAKAGSASLLVRFFF